MSVRPARLSEGALAGAIFFCPLALGTLDRWSIAVAAALALSALFLSRASPERDPIALPLLAWLLAGLAVIVALQCVPLPAWLARWLSPESAATYRFALAGFSASWHPLTLDGPASAREVAKAVTIAAAFAAACLLADSRRTRRRLAAALALAGAGIALIGYGHLLFDAHRLFGLPLLPGAHPPFVTTFGNKNNAAGFLALTSPVALGLSLSSHHRRQRAAWAVAYLLAGAAVFLTLSRGGIFAFLGGQAALGALLWAGRAPDHDSKRRARPAALVLALAAAVVAIAAYLAWGPIAARLATLPGAPHEGKIDGFGQTLPMLRDFFWTGAGRGAFPTAGARYLTFSSGTAEYVENEPLQAAVDLGVPLGAGLVAAVLLTFAGALRRKLDPLDCALAAGLLALALQNLVDFSLELPGVALPAAVALALLAAPPHERGPRSFSRLLSRRGAAVATAAGALLSAAGLLASPPAHAWRAETDAFAAAAGALPGAKAAKIAEGVLARHPASFVVPLAVGRSFLAAGQPAAALHWLDRALYFKPNLADTHLLTARALDELGQTRQALLEARTYFTASGGGGAALALLAVRHPGEIADAVARTAEGEDALAAFLADHGRLPEAVAAARVAVSLAMGQGEPHRVLALLLARAGDAGATAEAKQAVALAPEDERTWLALAQARRAAGDPAGEERVLRAGLLQLPGRLGLVVPLVRLDLSRHDSRAAMGALRLAEPPATLGARALVLSLRGEIHAAEGRMHLAEEEWRAASRLDPTGRHEWPLVGLLEQAARFREAAEMLRGMKVDSSDPDAPAIERRIADDERQEREAALSQARARLEAGP